MLILNTCVIYIIVWWSGVHAWFAVDMDTKHNKPMAPVGEWLTRIHGRQSGLEPFKTAQQTGLHPTSPAFFAWPKFSQVIKTGICEQIGMHTRKRHLQTVFVHARLRSQLSCLKRLSFDLSWILLGSPVSRVRSSTRSLSVAISQSIVRHPLSSKIWACSYNN